MNHSLFLRDAFILTLDKQQNVYSEGAVYIENGNIRWIGEITKWDAVALKEGYHPSVIKELKGKAILPGLINTHAHGGLSILRGICDEGDLFTWAKSIAPYTSYLNENDLRLGCYLAVMEQIASGTTCTCDCTRYGTTIFAKVASEIGLRSLSGALVNSPELRPAGYPNWPFALNDTEKGMDDYKDNPLVRFFLGVHSPYSCTPETILEVKKQADRLGIPFNIHAAESQKEVAIVQERYGLPPIAWLDSLGVLDETCIMDHAVWLTGEEINILQKRNVKVAHCPVSNAKLGSGVAPVPEMQQSGITVGLGTDSLLSNNSQDLWQEMKFAILLQRAIRTDGTVLSSHEVLKMATSDAADVIGWEDEVGSLQAGKQADLIVVDLPCPQKATKAEVESDIVYAGGRQAVEMVMVGGEIIYELGNFLKIDVEPVQIALQQRYEAIKKETPTL
jgi:5-methylthioadenosine/S-adenosylhomocysteine deaminase